MTEPTTPVPSQPAKPAAGEDSKTRNLLIFGALGLAAAGF